MDNPLFKLILVEEIEFTTVFGKYGGKTDPSGKSISRVIGRGGKRRVRFRGMSERKARI